ncbi:S-layer homology domain-containing protein [Paenibacillus sp. MBLB4367]|uniref:S-layer homology domain-containing protein n=1 Tax=Paenibacillus sp. MBLB4367 TaxID=3384767 RepID=UPI003908214B
MMFGFRAKRKRRLLPLVLSCALAFSLTGPVPVSANGQQDGLGGAGRADGRQTISESVYASVPKSASAAGTPLAWNVLTKVGGDQQVTFSVDNKISPDGRFVGFANPVVDPESSDFHTKLTVYDRTNGSFDSVLPSTFNNDVIEFSMTPDARYFAFTAKNLKDDSMPQVYVLDRQSGSIELISKLPGGGAAAGESEHPSISADGRYVAFQSAAVQLVPDDSDDYTDVFVYDRVAKMMERISKPAIPPEPHDSRNGFSERPSINADGRYVAFESFSDLLIPDDRNSMKDVFLYDRTDKRMKRISVSNTGEETYHESYRASISADGNVVAFMSDAVNLVPGDTNNKTDIYVYRHVQGTVERVSFAPDGKEDMEDSTDPFVSADGKYVAYSRNIPDSSGDLLDKAVISDLEAHTVIPVTVPDAPYPLKLPERLAVVSNGGEIVAYNSFYEAYSPEIGNYLTHGLFIASRVSGGSAPTWPAGSKLEASAIGSDTVTLTWPHATDVKGISGYRLFNNNTLADYIPYPEHTYKVTGLQGGTDYVFRVEAVNADNLMSSGGPAYTLKTPPDERSFKLSWVVDRYANGMPAPNSLLTIKAAGLPGRVTKATVTYQTWLDEQNNRLPSPRTASEVVPLSELTTEPGQYLGTFTVRHGIAELTSLTATMADGAGGTIERTAPEWPLQVAGTLQVTIANPGNVDMNGAGLSVWSSKYGGRSLRVSGGDPIVIEGLAAGDDYMAALQKSDGRPWVSQPAVRVEAGLQTDLTLNVPMQAKIRLKVIDANDNPVPDIRIEFWDEAGETYLNVENTDASGFTPWHETDEVPRTWIAKIDTKYTQYEAVPNLPIVLKPGNNEQTIKLRLPPEGMLRGKVTDPEGKPVFNAIVTTTQMNKEEKLVKQFYTNLNGEYAATLLAGDADVQVVMPNYHYFSDEGLKATIPENGTATFDIPLKTIDRGLIKLNVYVKFIDGDWQGPVDMQHMSFMSKISSKTGAGRTSYYQNSVEYQGRPGEEVEVCVTGSTYRLGTVCQNLTLDDNANGVAEIRLEEKGSRVRGQLPSFASGRAYANLYEQLANGTEQLANSEKIDKQGPFEIHVPKAGTYRLEIIRRSGEAGQSETGRVEFTIGSKQIKDLGSIAFHTNQHFIQPYENAFMALPNQAAPGGTVNLRAIYRNSGETVEGALLKVDIPEGMTPVKDANGNIAISGAKGIAVMNGSVLEIPLGDIPKNLPGKVSFKVKLDTGFNRSFAKLGAHITGTVQKKAINEQLGFIQLDVPAVTIDTPDRVAESKLTVVGTAPAGSRVRVYDSNVLLAVVDASPVGFWQATVELADLGSPSVHALRAEADSKGTVMHSEQNFVHYERNQPILTEMAMVQLSSGRWVRMDVKKGVAQMPYTVVPGNPFEFQLKFSEPDKVSEVQLYMNGQSGDPIQAVRGADGLFRAIVPTTKGALGGIYVAYETKKPKLQLEPRVPTDAEIRSALPASMRDFEVVSRNPFQLEGNVYSGKAVIKFPQAPGVTMTVKLSIDTKPAVPYKPTLEEIVQAESTGVLVFNSTLDVVESEQALNVTSTGYIPKKQLLSLTGATLGISRQSVQMMSPLGGIELDDILDEIDLPKYNDMLRFSSDVQIDIMEPYGKVKEVKEMYTGYKDYAGKINKIMNNVEVGISCPENAEVTGEQAGKALLVTVGGEVAKTALGAWTGAMALEGPVGILAGYATKYVSTKIDSYVDEQIDAVGAGVDAKACKPDEEDPEEENIYKKRVKRLPRGKIAYRVAKPRWIYDPSGYVYEAVAGNRLEDVKATVLYRKPSTNEWAVWDEAADYAQTNPQWTDGEGRYGWDVPEGKWKVVWEKDGYDTANSAELEVPPPHFDVNMGLVSHLPPRADTITAVTYEGGSYIDVAFTKYIQTTIPLGDRTITVKGTDGAAIPGTAQYVNAEQSPTGDRFTRTVRFTPNAGSLTAGSTYQVTITPGTIVSYAGALMIDEAVKSVQAVVRDITGPHPTSASAQSGNRVIRLAFDRALKADAALDAEKFKLNGTNAAVLAAVLDRPVRGEKPRDVILTLSAPFSEGTAVTVAIEAGAVHDAGGNPSEAATVSLSAPNALLANLSITNGTLTAPFASNQTDYTVKVNNDVQSLTINATLADPGATLVIGRLSAKNGMDKEIQIPSSGIIIITVQAAGHPEIMREYKLVVERTSSGGEQPGGEQPGGQQPTPANPAPANPLDLGRDARLTRTTGSDGGTTLLVEVQTAAVQQALQKSEQAGQLFLNVTEAADHYKVQVPADAFRMLIQAKADMKLRLNSAVMNVQTAAWSGVWSDKMTAVSFGVSKPAVSEEHALLRDITGRYGSLRPITGMLRFAVEAQEGDKAVSLPMPLATPMAIEWVLKEKPGAQSSFGLYGYDPESKEWKYYPGEIDAELNVMKFTANAAYMAILSYTGTFADIADHWAQRQIDWMASRLLVDGYSTDSFKPEQQVTRAEFAAMLVRLLGLKPATSGKPTFDDVKPVDWFYDAVQAAAAAKLAEGDDKGQFKPTDIITREQMTVMVWRAYKRLYERETPVQPAEQERLLAAFADRGVIQEWAKADVAEAVKEGLVQGVGDTRFDPSGPATRAQSAALLQRIAEKLEKKQK